MQWAVSRLLVISVVLPAILIITYGLLLLFHILPKKESFLRENLETQACFEVQEADSLVFIDIEPLEQLFYMVSPCFKPPRLNNFFKIF